MYIYEMGQFNNLCLGDGLGLVEVESGRINTTHNVYQAAVQVSVQGVPLHMTILDNQKTLE